eukprot:1828353-Rhodomonas_salina.1
MPGIACSSCGAGSCCSSRTSGTSGTCPRCCALAGRQSEPPGSALACSGCSGKPSMCGSRTRSAVARVSSPSRGLISIRCALIIGSVVAGESSVIIPLDGSYIPPPACPEEAGEA